MVGVEVGPSIEIWHYTRIILTKDQREQIEDDLSCGGEIVPHTFTTKIRNFTLRTTVPMVRMKYGETPEGEPKYDTYFPSGTRSAVSRSASKAMLRLGQRELAIDLRGLKVVSRINKSGQIQTQLPLAS
jgi:hypothetical protein